MSEEARLGGRVWKYANDVNTDVIFPGKYTYTLRTPEEIAPHALEDLDPRFVAEVRRGDIIVAGRNWGCGSSREQAATCLVYHGVAAVVACSFGRIFYRNAINNGLAAIVCPAAVGAVEDGDWMAVDLGAGLVRCEAGEFPFPPIGDSLVQILEAGGLVPWARARLQT